MQFHQVRQLRGRERLTGMRCWRQRLLLQVRRILFSLDETRNDSRLEKRKVVKDRPAHAKHSAAPVPRQSTSRLSTRSVPPPTGAANSTSPPIQPGASSVLTKLASFVPVINDDATKNTVTRSSAFGQQAAIPPVAEESRTYGAKRDDNLALIEDLEIGPYEHKAPFDDPHFEQLEPNSGIRLSCVVARPVYALVD